MTPAPDTSPSTELPLGIATAPPSREVRQDPDPRQLVARMCAMYSVTVYSDGSVQWVGISDVRVKGPARAVLKPRDLQALIDAFRAVSFFSLYDKYDCHEPSTAKVWVCGSDSPSYSLTFSDAGRTKSVFHDTGDGIAPTGLTKLEQRVDEITDTKHWIQ